MRDSKSSTGEHRDEIEANFFAAELLMPRDVLTKRLLSGKSGDYLEIEFDETLRELASEFGISQQALTVRLVRLVQLGFLSTE